MKTKNHSIDMLHGPLLGKLLRFALPIVITSIVQQLFNSADTAIIGRFGTSGALAAVGTNGEIVAMVVSLSAGLAIGFNVLIAKYIGSGKRDSIRAAVSTSVLAAGILGILLLIVGQLTAMPLMQLIHTPQDILEDAVRYLRIYFLSIPFLLLYDFIAAIYRAKGDSKKPLLVLLCSGVLNVLLNLLFVIGCGMNIAGVAVATLLATAVSALILFCMLLREKETFSMTCTGFSGNCLLQILRIGIPAALQGAVFCFANIFIQASVNRFGSDAVAGSSISMMFEYLAYYIITAFGQAATTFISQNYAAGKLNRCKKVLWLCMVFAFFACAAIIIPLTVFSQQMSEIFTSNPQEIQMSCLRIVMVLMPEPICACYEIPASAMRGLGYSTIPAVEMILGICLFRILWIFTVFQQIQTLQCLYVVFPVTWVVTTLTVGISCCILWRKVQKAI